MKPDERYTWRACADGYTDTGLRKGITEGNAICQLADYEDMGLSPEEVKQLMSANSCNGIWIEQITNLVADVNPAEITFQARERNLEEWCLNWRRQMKKLINTAPLDYSKEREENA